jgi:hypothetical protein
MNFIRSIKCKNSAQYIDLLLQMVRALISTRNKICIYQVVLATKRCSSVSENPPSFFRMHTLRSATF